MHPDHERALHRFSFPKSRVKNTDTQQLAPAPYETVTAIVKNHTNHWLFQGLDTFRPMLIRASSYKWSLAVSPKSLDCITLVDSAGGAEVNPKP